MAAVHISTNRCKYDLKTNAAVMARVQWQLPRADGRKRRRI
jgi:hypothetical protein